MSGDLWSRLSRGEMSGWTNDQIKGMAQASADATIRAQKELNEMSRWAAEDARQRRIDEGAQRRFLAHTRARRLSTAWARRRHAK